MTKQQKLILTSLSIVAALILAGLSCAVIYLVTRGEVVPAEPAVAAAPPQPTTPPTFTPALLAPVAVAPATATPPPPPSPTSTRVIRETVTPTPLPPPVNCLDKISNFEASGIMTNEEVAAFLRQSVPVSHLDRCQSIKYIPKAVSVHATPAAGRFIPIFRQISVYAIDPAYQGIEDLRDTLIHETGHNVHFNLRLDNWEVAQQWSVLYRQSQESFARNGQGFVSGYAQMNEFEDFAESYRAYVLAPNVLKSYSPEKYDYIRQVVFAGQER